MQYYPEGMLYGNPKNDSTFDNIDSLNLAKNKRCILEGIATCCDENHNLIVSLPKNLKGIIPREEGAIGIKEGTTKDIALISKVSKPVCFVITDGVGTDKLVLSRKLAQQMCYQDYISNLSPGDVIPATTTHFENYGTFVDIGCGITSLIPINLISVSRISHPKDRFTTEQNIYVVIKSIEDNGRICLSHKELLGTWTQNAKQFHPGETVCGIVRSITTYGIFVELKPNLAGLAEDRNDMDIKPGNIVSVYIKNLIPDKMKVKLVIVDSSKHSYTEQNKSQLQYFIKEGHIQNWYYSPENCNRVIETVFGY